MSLILLLIYLISCHCCVILYCLVIVVLVVVVLRFLFLSSASIYVYMCVCVCVCVCVRERLWYTYFIRWNQTLFSFPECLGCCCCCCRLMSILDSAARLVRFVSCWHIKKRSTVCKGAPPPPSWSLLFGICIIILAAQSAQVHMRATIPKITTTTTTTTKNKNKNSVSA